MSIFSRAGPLKRILAESYQSVILSLQNVGPAVYSTLLGKPQSVDNISHKNGLRNSSKFPKDGHSLMIVTGITTARDRRLSLITCREERHDFMA